MKQTLNFHNEQLSTKQATVSPVNNKQFHQQPLSSAKGNIQMTDYTMQKQKPKPASPTPMKTIPF
jgi:hypothetical protein